MFNGVLLGIVVTLAVALIGAYTVLRSGLIPANADATPGRLENWIAQTSLEATLRRDAPNGENPVALTDMNLALGVPLFSQHCAGCHGSAKGAATASPLAKGLYPKPPQLAIDGIEVDPQGFTFCKIKHGIRLTGMPSFGNSLSDRQIWTLVLFLKHLDKLPPAAQQMWLRVRI